MKSVYFYAKEFKKKYPLTVAFRLDKHAKVIEKHLNDGEEIINAFCAQKNESSVMVCNSCVVAITNNRLLVAQKRFLWGYFLTSITPDMYNDIKVIRNLVWSDIEIDTITENIYLSNIETIIQASKFARRY